MFIFNLYKNFNIFRRYFIILNLKYIYTYDKFIYILVQ